MFVPPMYCMMARTWSGADRCRLCRLSHIGMNKLTTDGAVRPTEGSSLCQAGLLSSDTISAVLMLPQLENVLQRAMDDLHRSSTQSSHATNSSKPPADGVTTDETGAALRHLLVLVRYSRHVRDAILAADGETDTVSKADVSVPVQVASV